MIIHNKGTQSIKKVMLWFKKQKPSGEFKEVIINWVSWENIILTTFLIQSGKETDNYFAKRLCQKNAVWRNKVGMLVIRCNSLIWFRSIFSSDKAESGNKLDRGRKLVRWGREKMREFKKKGTSGSSTR